MKTKNRKRGGAAYLVIIVILLAVIAFSLYKIGGILYEYHKGTVEYERTQKLAGTEDLSRESSYKVDFAALKKENADIRAWIYSEDTVINYPVVQGEDNQFYLYRMFNKEWNGKGSIFIDYRCAHPFSDFNTILYGHRMKDGSMFCSLAEYREKEYYEAHRRMLLITPEAEYELLIFGVLTIDADSDMYRFSFADQEEKEDYLDRIRENSELDTEVSVTAEDRIVMLSTCTYEFEDARLVVYGKLVETEEE